MTKTEYEWAMAAVKRVAKKSKGIPGQIVVQQHPSGIIEVWFEPTRTLVSNKLVAI